MDAVSLSGSSPIFNAGGTSSATASASVTNRPVIAASASDGPGFADEASYGTDAKDRNKVEAAASDLNSFAKSAKQDLDFSVDGDSGAFVVKVVDNQSGRVVRQIPSEDALKMADKLEELRSLMFETKA